MSCDISYLDIGHQCTLAFFTQEFSESDPSEFFDNKAQKGILVPLQKRQLDQTQKQIFVVKVNFLSSGSVSSTITNRLSIFDDAHPLRFGGYIYTKTTRKKEFEG